MFSAKDLAEKKPLLRQICICNKTLWLYFIIFYFSPNRPTGPIRSSSHNVYIYMSRFHVNFCHQEIPGYGWNLFRVLLSRVLITETEFRTLKNRTLKKSITYNILIKSAIQSPDQWDRVQDSEEQNSEEVHNLQYLNKKCYSESWSMRQSSGLWRTELWRSP